MIIRYVQVLIRHAVNLFSLASLVIGLLAAVFFQFGGVINVIIITVAACISILFAGYFAWKEEIEQHPKGADLSIASDLHVFTATSTSRGVPHSPMRFSILLDAINRGEEPVTLRSFTVTRFEMNNQVLDSIPQKTELSLRNAPHGYRQIVFPFTVDKKNRLNLEYSIFVKLNVTVPLEFARRVVELKNYEIELSYTFDDMKRVSQTRTIAIHGSFDDYVQECIKDWADVPNQHELAIAAQKAKGII